MVESPTICEESDDIVPKAESPTLLGQDGADGADDADNEAQDDADNESPVNSEQCVESATASEPVEEISSSEKQDVEENSSIPDQCVAGNADEDNERAEEEAAEMKAEGKAGEVGEDGDAAPTLSHGRKDAALSNNVIEEMTREQRRNKVRVLAGAFEIVISLR